MRTKALMVAATLAAGLASSMAQSNVYSLNIVGYANVPIQLGNQLYANPLDLDGVNNAGNIFNLSPLNNTYSQPANTMNSFTVLTWNGNGFNHVYYENDFTSANTAGVVTNGWGTDSNPSGQGVPPNLPPGLGFFINNAGLAGTNTFVGNVRPAPGTTNTIAVVLGNAAYGSALPVAGQIANNDGSPNPFQLPLSPLNNTYSQPAGTVNSFTILTWNGNGYNHVYYENDFTSANTAGVVTNGWGTDSNPSGQAVPPTIAVGQGFFINNAGLAGSWAQTLTNSP
jgi:hypothetical protein